MIDVSMFPGETAEDLARRVASILACDRLPEPPPYLKDNGGWTLDRSNNWSLHDGYMPQGVVRIAHRYQSTQQLQALIMVLRDIDGRTVTWRGGA